MFVYVSNFAIYILTLVRSRMNEWRGWWPVVNNVESSEILTCFWVVWPLSFLSSCKLFNRCMKIEGHSCRDKRQWIEHDLFSEYWFLCYYPDTTSIRENILRICWYRHLLTMTSWSFINLHWVFPLNHEWLARGIIDQGVSRRMCLTL